MFTRPEFLKKMHVEELDTNLFRGDALPMGLPRVFGGQVLGQAMNAAVRTVEPERRPHSLHGYFLRPGDVSRPIIYEVDPIRNGRSFSTRRVVAKQRGEAIFNGSISFQKIEEGLDHQYDLPDDVPDPESIAPDYDTIERFVSELPSVTMEQFRSQYLVFSPDVVDLRTPWFERSVKAGAHEPRFGFWFKFSSDIGDDPIMHRTLLAFISDKALMSTGLLPHSTNFLTHKIIGASLDHAMWFHSEIRVDQWIWYDLESPRAARARDLNQGRFFTRDGELIASTMQEGLIRVVGEKTP